MALAFTVPDRATPLTSADGKTMSMPWYMAISAIVQQLGGPAVVPGGSISNDALTLEAFDDALSTSDLVPSLANQSNSLSIEISAILEEGMDVINKAQQALQSAIIEQMTMIEVIRSMASQDASHVDIRGGLIDGTVIGSRTPAAATVTTLNKIIFTAPATSATIIPADGSTFSTVGAYAITFTFTGATGVTFPTSGTLPTLAGTEALTNKTYNGNTWTAGTGTLTIGAGLTLNAGPGGTLGTAAFTSAGAYQAAGSYAQLAGSSSQAFAASTLTASGAFGCNGKTAQTAYSLGGASTDLATVIVLANNLRLMSIGNGIGQ